MKIIKTFEAFGEPIPKEGKQFRVVKKGKGVMPSTFTVDMITDLWGDLLSAKDFDGVVLSSFIKVSTLRDSWENNNLKLTCVQLESEDTDIEIETNASNSLTDQYQITVTGTVSKRVTTYKLNGEDILKTYNGKNDETLAEFVKSSAVGDKWTSKNIEIVKL